MKTVKRRTTGRALEDDVAMSETVSVRCPVCRREHLYAAPSYPCECGAPVCPPLDRYGAPAAVAHQVWEEAWVAVECAVCGRRTQWPRPELGCGCGTVLRIPVAGGTCPESGAGVGRDVEPGVEPGVEVPAPPRRAFQPITIRTARDAVTVAALYLRWLGYQDIRRADQRPPSGIGLAARGLLAQVDPTVRPASPRDVECLWLTAMTESSDCVYFSLAGYTTEARTRADSLGVPLFVLDLTGTPQPVNTLADELNGP
ncbi:endogenous inhibitor of DNA gyrase (YacG/DUF329 family) [Streptomyces sp. SAI-135]|nr:endogenous inhibitor of DNA gyrase (YacG/DUF329 family) [Streptomyces sp. SAI-090]MDH6588161.1 endogenous inhibitor of DNA gyrase (YacG/DUF329 family) [Streptomyces sp. SAI-133]MDH6620315.1 endogenous inhibitor of DNA gyrase (YacG/DUF329 family) [Streptomyces sp. SAI-135]